MIKSFGSWDELMSAMDGGLKATLQQDVGNYLNDLLREYIAVEIYGVYSPKPNAWVTISYDSDGNRVAKPSTYRRRYSLLDGISAIMLDDHTVSSSNNAKPDTPIGRGFNMGGIGGSGWSSGKGGWNTHGRRGGFLQMWDKGWMGFLSDNGAESPAPRRPVTHAQEYVNSHLDEVAAIIEENIASRART